MNGMHVIYVPPSVLDHSPNMWLQMVTKHRGMSLLVALTFDDILNSVTTWPMLKLAKIM